MYADRIDEVARDAFATPLRTLTHETSLYVASGEGRVIVVEGKSGMGKQILQRVYIGAVRRLSYASLLLLESYGELVGQQISFGAWRRIFQQLFAHAIGAPRSSMSFADVARACPPVAEMFDIESSNVLAVLNDVLPFKFPLDGTDDVTCDDSVLALAARALAALLIAVDNVPKLVVIGNGSFMDSASWRLITELHRSVCFTKSCAIIFLNFDLLNRIEQRAIVSARCRVHATDAAAAEGAVGGAVVKQCASRLAAQAPARAVVGRTRAAVAAVVGEQH